jgi:hypothetical protein|uniref:Uncharacterized protein n=1 Tax=Meiothermus ruber TaxID=277 RepID=A0A7C3HS08_MEIRU
MVLQTPRDVVRELKSNPGQEYDIRPARGYPTRAYALKSGSLVIWKFDAWRAQTGFVELTEVELGQGPYLVQRVPEVAK